MIMGNSVCVCVCEVSSKPTVVGWRCIWRAGSVVRGWRAVVRGRWWVVVVVGDVSGCRSGVNGRHGRRRRMITDPGPGQSAFQKMTETGDVDGSSLGRRPVMMVMMNTVHQTTFDLPGVRLPLTFERILPAACSVDGGVINRWCGFITQNKMMMSDGSRW